jgi:hypothetical protein
MSLGIYNSAKDVLDYGNIETKFRYYLLSCMPSKSCDNPEDKIPG